MEKEIQTSSQFLKMHGGGKKGSSIFSGALENMQMREELEEIERLDDLSLNSVLNLQKLLARQSVKLLSRDGSLELFSRARGLMEKLDKLDSKISGCASGKKMDELQAEREYTYRELKSVIMEGDRDRQAVQEFRGLAGDIVKATAVEMQRRIEIGDMVPKEQVSTFLAHVKGIMQELLQDNYPDLWNEFTDRMEKLNSSSYNPGFEGDTMD